jgi:hypothetical protein
VRVNRFGVAKIALSILLGALCIFCVGWLVIPREQYPVRVSIAFDYKGRHFEKEHLTVVEKRIVYGFPFTAVRAYSWEPVRRKIAVLLPDGSLVVLGPEWSRWAEGFGPGDKYPTKMDWFWFDNAQSPKQAVYGTGWARISPFRDEPARFTRIEPNASIERVSDAYLSNARLQDSARDESAKLENADGPFLGYFPIDGELYSGFDIAPIRNTSSKPLIGTPGWINTATGCHAKAILAGQRVPVPVGVFEQKTGLLLRDGIWSSAGGSRVLEPIVMYPTGRQVHSSLFGFGDRSSSLLQLIHTVEWKGQICAGITSPPTTIALAVEFPDGKLGLITKSTGTAVWNSKYSSQ